MKYELMEKVRFPSPGRYVMAASGGVDSMSLLDMLVNHGGYELFVVHCNHGIREDSDNDERLVHETAATHGLPFHGLRLGLGAEASEARARGERYRFLEEVRQEVEAEAIITAHHLDDRIETMLLNEARGAGWLGRAPLREESTMKRPLLEVTKSELQNYAKRFDVKWREDATNLNPYDNERNRIRQQLSETDRPLLYDRLQQYDEERNEREERVRSIVKTSVRGGPGRVRFGRDLFNYDVATVRDVLFLTLRDYFITHMEIDYDAVVRLEHFYKTAATGKQLPLSGRVWASMSRDGMVIATY